MNIQYIEFNGKHPAQSKENRRYAERPRKNWSSYGASYGGDFLKVDIDDLDHKTEVLEEPVRGMPRSDAVVAMLDSLGIRYNGQKTPHGKHLFFRKPDWMEQKNKPTWYSPLAVKMEWKFPTSDDHIVVMVNGEERPFFKGSIDNTDVDELPPFLYPLQKGRSKPFDLTFPKGDRTQKLGAYLFYLVRDKGFSAEQAFEIVRLMNAYIFDEPIPPDLLEAQILNDSTMKKLTEQQKGKALTHSDVAKEIIERFDLLTVNSGLYAYENGVYRPFNENRITSYLTENYPKLNANYEREVLRHIRGLTYTEYPDDDGTVNVRNGILHFDESGAVTFSPHYKEHISFKQFNAIYDPDATSPVLDEALFKAFEGNSTQLELFNQVLGYLMMNHVRYQKIFFFVGVPSTGKTTILMMVRDFCGTENVSAIQLDDMHRPFGLASIVDKTANIFSDLKKTKVLSSDTFKMLADGSPVMINQKHKPEFVYCFTGKLLFGMNDFPDFSKDMSGIERRLVIFEFKHLFLRDNPDYDSAIGEKLKSDECMSALLNKAIAGYKSLMEHDGFIITKESESALLAFVSDNDNVIRWLHESEIDEEYLLREPIKTDAGGGLYREYQAYCITIGEEPKAQKDFSRTICNRYGLETWQKHYPGGKRFPTFRRKRK